MLGGMEELVQALPEITDVTPAVLEYRMKMLNKRLLESPIGIAQRVESELIRRGISRYVDLEEVG